MQSLRLPATWREDRFEHEYFFTRPNLPVLVDLSKCVIFVRPWEEPICDENGVPKKNADGSPQVKRGADIDIKMYTGKREADKEEFDPDETTGNSK